MRKPVRNILDTMRVLRTRPTVLVLASSPRGNPEFRAVLGMRALEIPTSPQTGISLDALEIEIEIEIEMAMQSHDNIKAVVLVPHLQNPLDSSMPDAHKQDRMQMCDHYGVAMGPCAR